MLIGILQSYEYVMMSCTAAHCARNQNWTDRTCMKTVNTVLRAIIYQTGNGTSWNFDINCQLPSIIIKEVYIDSSNTIMRTDINLYTVGYLLFTIQQRWTFSCVKAIHDFCKSRDESYTAYICDMWCYSSYLIIIIKCRASEESSTADEPYAYSVDRVD